MVIVRVHMMIGRSREQKRDLIAGLTDAVARNVGVPAEAVRVLLIELTRHEWGIGGVPVGGTHDV